MNFFARFIHKLRHGFHNDPTLHSELQSLAETYNHIDFIRISSKKVETILREQIGKELKDRSRYYRENYYCLLPDSVLTEIGKLFLKYPVKVNNKNRNYNVWNCNHHSLRMKNMVNMFAAYVPQMPNNLVFAMIAGQFKWFINTEHQCNAFVNDKGVAKLYEPQQNKIYNVDAGVVIRDKYI